ncbi:MAG: YhcG family protein [Bilifractor sp.]
MENNMVTTDENYRKWIRDISSRFRQSQLKAAVKVNDEMLRFYWLLGRDMEEKKQQYAWGSDFYFQVSQDLRKALPDVKSFSKRNLQYMNQFYRTFPDAVIMPQADAQNTTVEIAPQAGAQIKEGNVFLIPWGHIKVILDKCSDNKEKALYFVWKTLENHWSRAVLLNFLDTNLYERQGKAATNFTSTLPSPQSDLAQAITKDPYNFDFLTMTERYNEKELKDALMDNIQSFLLELGNGFSFVGREVALDVGQTEKFLDMLFFNINLKCYVVLEVKVTEFDSSFAGQLGTYVVAVNHQLKQPWMNPTIGLLVCKSMDKVEAQYALESTSQPIGVSGYELSKLIPEEFKGSLPSIDEIESELNDDSSFNSMKENRS